MSGLDHRQDEVEGNIKSYEAQLEAFKETLDHHKFLLVGQFSKLSDLVGSRDNEDIFVQQQSPVPVNISSSEEQADDNKEDHAMVSGHSTT